MLESVQKINPIVYDHKKYVRLSIQQVRWILKSLGVWPKSLESSSSINTYSNILINIICISLVTFLFVPLVVFVVLEVKDTYSILKFTGPLVFDIMIFIDYSLLILHERDIRVCIEYVKSDWINTQHDGDHMIMVRSAEFGRRLVIICVLFSYGGIMFYHITMPISMGKIMDPDINITYQPLAYPVARVLIDVRYSPVNEIFFWIQCLAAFVLQTVPAAICGLTAVLAMHAYGRLEILMQWIVHLVDGREDFCNEVDERLAMIVKEHTRILRFISLIEEISHKISLVEIVGCTINMCLLGYYVIKEWETGELANYVTYIILLISFTFNIFIFCYIGELVADQCKRVSEISYMIDWHRLSGKKSLGVILIMAMSNSSVKLTAGNTIDLSISSFGDVIKTSVAYLNMLRTLTS